MMRHIDLRSMSYDGVNKLTEKEIESGVRNHINWMQNAVYDMVEFDFETGEHRGHTVERDCAADDAYDDPDILQSLIGDFLPLQEDSFATFCILYFMWESGHSAIKKAVEKMAHNYIN
jgi:hypothetical protein